MASSSDLAATEALIAQLIAEDLEESYQRHAAPIGASYHDYEEPLSSYERQCLDAENNPDAGEGCSGWGDEDCEGFNHAATPHEGELSMAAPDSEGTWDSKFVNEEGQVQDHSDLDELPPYGEDDHSALIMDPNPLKEEFTGPPARVVSPLTCNAPTNTADEARNNSAPTIISSQPTPDIWPDPIPVHHDHLAPSDGSSPPKTFIPSDPPPPNEPPPPATTWDIEAQWDDGLDYSSHKGKGKAVRAYDEFKRGLRHGERDQSRDPDIADSKEQDDADHDSEEDEKDSEVADEDLPFIRIPWPSRADTDELLSRREEAEVVEIRVRDEETLESILRDISLRDERRRKGKGAEGVVGSGGEQQEWEREDVQARNPDAVATWW